VVASWAAQVPPTPFDRAAAATSLEAFGGGAEFEHAPPDLTQLSASELVSRYVRLTNAPVPNRPSPYFGKARGHDVVFILLGTTPVP
jgi:hypothetical protein